MSIRAAVLGVIVSTGAFAQAHFDVASVKPSTLTGEGSRRERITADPSGLIMYNVSLSSAIQWAYGVRDYQVSGPGWINDQRYEITAKPAQPADDAKLREMLQSLLAERLKVALHHEKKELTAYALTVAKSGMKLKPGNPDGKSVLTPVGDSKNPMSFTAQDTSIGDIVDAFSRISRQLPDVPPVIDMTGLTGRFNFTVDASTLLQSFGDETKKGAPDISGLISGVQEILDKQLGLKAELRKAPADMLIVDHAEKVPTGN